jgi:EAL domain-containing protein (putative c-di-GMP-specific phosphodiesterase class I)
LIELGRRHRHARTSTDPHTGLTQADARSEGLDAVDAARADRAVEDGRGISSTAAVAVADTARTRTIEADLPGVVDANQLVVHYQPIVRLSAAEWIGAEALVRWHHPELGVVMPDEFIPLAEDLDLIGAIDQHVLRVALHDMAAGRVPGHEIAVNASPADLVPGLPDVVAAELWDSGVAPAALVVEVTERLRVDQRPEAVQVLRELVDLGVRVAVDDFGAGATSLANLRQMPVARLKLDRSLVADLDGPDARSAALVVRALAQLSSDLGVEVLGEGVETPRQAEMLISEGVMLGQGFLFGRPAALSVD